MRLFTHPSNTISTTKIIGTTKSVDISINKQFTPLFASRLSYLSKQISTAHPTKKILLSTLLCGSLGLTGCFSGDDAKFPNSFNEPQNDSFSNATLIDEPITTKTFTAKELKAAVEAAGLTDAVGADPVCGVTVEYMNHTTTGLKGEATNATGAVMLPNGDADDCQGARPITLYAHGTSPFKNYNLAALNDPENPAYAAALLIAASLAGQGDIVIAPNYPGYDKSDLDYAPYITLQQGKQMLDGLQAGKLALKKMSENSVKSASTRVSASDKLFITGYSQGGYVAMATAEALDNLGKPATAVSPGAGPYAMGAFADSIMAGNVISGGTIFLPMLTASYNAEYEGVANNVFAEKYADASTLLPTNDALLGLFFLGKLPTTGLFETAPNGYDILAPLSPPSAKYAYGFDETNYLFATKFRADYVSDMNANPDGIYPTFALPANVAKATLPVRQAFIKNDLRSYAPQSPMLLCGANQDPSVSYDVNSYAQTRIWQNNANVSFATVDLDLTNQDERAEMGKKPYISTLPTLINNQVSTAASSIQQAFTTNLTTMLQQAADAGYAKAISEGKTEQEAQTAAQTASYKELLSNYHSMAAPYCLSAANVFFEQYR